MVWSWEKEKRKASSDDFFVFYFVFYFFDKENECMRGKMKETKKKRNGKRDGRFRGEKNTFLCSIIS
jgi:hypothetical protein